ncbi:hypothetical protein GEV33_005538 [Tenebrio molitor]|uniref:Uncharacterized protein n=1 Tax=Tenebrio molitor TaxID=7067 RepID=A0A8J6LES9_TENMO|nr:hypothetical protein GEV33_005538 [Tenebrio molitor]
MTSPLAARRAGAATAALAGSIGDDITAGYRVTAAALEDSRVRISQEVGPRHRQVLQVQECKSAERTEPAPVAL